METNQFLPVNSSGIGLPDINKKIRERLAGVHIDVLDLNMHGDTLRISFFNNILANILAPDVVRTVGNDRGKDAAWFAIEDGSRIVRTISAGLVVYSRLPLAQLIRITACMGL